MRRNQQQITQQQAMKMAMEFQKKQEELARATFEGTAGGGVVTLTLNGSFEVVAVKISPEVVDPEDVASLEDLFVAAAHDAFEKVRVELEKVSGPLNSLMGGMKLPGMF